MILWASINHAQPCRAGPYLLTGPLRPTQLYGPGGDYHPTHSHVIPALIRKFHEAKQRGNTSVTVWGISTPRREFLYSADMADACLHLKALPRRPLHRAAGLRRERDWPLRAATDEH